MQHIIVQFTAKYQLKRTELLHFRTIQHIFQMVGLFLAYLVGQNIPLLIVVKHQMFSDVNEILLHLGIGRLLSKDFLPNKLSVFYHIWVTKKV